MNADYMEAPILTTTEANNIAQYEEIRASNRETFDDGGNREYRKILNKYKAWVDSYPNRNEELDLVEGKYISCTAIIAFYLNVESKRRCSRETAERTRNALDKLAEYEGAGLSPLRSNENATEVYKVIEEVLNALEKKVSNPRKRRIRILICVCQQMLYHN
jgi:ribosome-associated translation inhibitor RaiA